jgi:hypothetical protein
MKHEIAEQIRRAVEASCGKKLLQLIATATSEDVIVRRSTCVVALAGAFRWEDADLSYFHDAGLYDDNEIAYVSLVVWRRSVHNEPVFIDDLIAKGKEVVEDEKRKYATPVTMCYPTSAGTLTYSYTSYD